MVDERSKIEKSNELLRINLPDLQVLRSKCSKENANSLISIKRNNRKTVIRRIRGHVLLN